MIPNLLTMPEDVTAKPVDPKHPLADVDAVTRRIWGEHTQVCTRSFASGTEHYTPQPAELYSCDHCGNAAKGLRCDSCGAPRRA